MRVLLVPPKSNYPAPGPVREPLGLGFPYVAAALRAAGHDVFGVNLNTRWCHGGAPLALDLALQEALDRWQPDLVGLGGLAPDYRFIRDAITVCRAKAPGLHIVCGGGIITHDPEYVFGTLRPDFGIVGDGERAVVALADHLARHHPDAPTGVPNLLYWQHGEARATEERCVDDLDDLAFPDHEPFDVEGQFRIVSQGDRWLTTFSRPHPREMAVSLARSCPFQCTFCCHQTARPYRRRKVVNAVTEIEALYDRYRFNLLTMHDELFATAAERVEEFCEALIDARRSNRMDFDWSCSLRVTTITERSRRWLRLMKQAGCAYVGFGIESGSQRILDSMRKGITVAQTIRAMRLADEAGLGVQGCLILGDPAETAETLTETVAFYRTHCRPFLINYSWVTPYPGSAIFDDALARGVIPGREPYYNRISSIGDRQYNLTTLDEAAFARLAGAAIEESCRSWFEAPASSWTRDGGASCDRDAPFDRRRDQCRIRCACPHCGATVEREYPLLVEYAAGLRLPCVCDHCCRRFDVVLPQTVPDDVAAAAARDRLPDSMRKPEYEGDPEAIFTYRGHTVVRFSGRIYVVPLTVGALNFHSEVQRTQPGIRVCATVEEGLAWLESVPPKF